MSAAHVVVDTINLSDDLTEHDQWVVWRLERGTKVPYGIRGRKASSTDPSTWATFEQANDTLCRFPRQYAGLGFVFSTTDGLTGIDLDDCLDAHAKVKLWAGGIVERFADTYMEISPSGKGLKIWARGSLPSNVPKVRIEDGGIEMYDHARYFTVTGRVFRGAPLQIENHADDLLLMHNRLTASKLKGGWPLQPIDGGRIPYGSQHHTLVSIMGTLRARRVCDAAIEACLQIVNQQQCEKPGRPQNISQMVRSSRTWSAR